MYIPLLLTKSTTFIIGPIAALLGYLMNGIFWILDRIGIPNIGLAIIFFTIIIYMALMPLTVRQQKFSKLQVLMQPELTKIQNKYKNKKDQDSVMRMNEETQAVYRKYGVSPMGSCVQMLIQLPILFALYRVIYNIPAYVTQVKNAFFPLVDQLIATSGASDYLQSTSAAAQFARQFSNESFTSGVTTYVENTFIDVLNRFSTGDWEALAVKFPQLSDHISNTTKLLYEYNNFLGLNIGNSPWFTLRNAWTAGSVIGIIAAVIVPVLAAATQLINVALMPQPSQQKSGNEQADQMASSMKTMNYIMPIMSAWFCFTLPAGMGLYWIAGSVIRSVQQVLINKSINKMDMQAYLEKNMEKANRKAAKSEGRQTVSQRVMNQYSNMNTRSLESRTKVQTADDKEKEARLEQAHKAYESGHYRPGSLAAKAHMVEKFNDADVTAKTSHKSSGQTKGKTSDKAGKE